MIIKFSLLKIVLQIILEEASQKKKVLLEEAVSHFVNLLVKRENLRSARTRVDILPEPWLLDKLWWDDFQDIDSHRKYRTEILSGEKGRIVYESLRGKNEVTAESLAENINLSLSDIKEALIVFNEIGFLQHLESNTYQVNTHKLILLNEKL